MTKQSTPKSLERLSTGDPALDEILAGGIPTQSVVIIAGEPGSGKTVFALKMLFEAARQGRKCLYITTLAEPAIKLFRYMELFPFFDRALLDKQVVFADLGAALAKGVDATLTELSRRLEELEPAIVVIDSFKAMGDLLRDATGGRSFIYDLAVQMATWGATTLLVGEYTLEEIRTLPEFGIADGVIQLGTARHELTSVRELEVRKLRGVGYVSGRHFFDITDRGVTCYPRVRSPELPDGGVTSTTERVPMGIRGLDELLGGGVPQASSTIVQGATGTGKTLIGLHFLMEGARRGERGVLFSLEESLQQLRGIALNYGWDLEALEKQGLISLHHTSPVEMSTDKFLERARQRFYSPDTRRVVLDSLTSMALGVPSERRFKELVYAITKHARAAGVSLLGTMETTELLGSAALPGQGVSFAADNMVLLRYIEAGGQLERAISVLKARGIQHSTQMRTFTIGTQGIEVSSNAFRDKRGVLTGDSSAASRKGA